VWTVTAVTPMARVIEGVRGGSMGFLKNYILLHNADAENRRLREEVGKLKLDNIFLKNQLNTAERAKALQVFQAHTPSRTVAATVIGSGAGSNSKVVFVDAGVVSGVERGMGVVTPDGIVGKVIAVYPTASEVLLINDPDFAAGVASPASGARGTLKGQGTPMCKVDYVPPEVKVQAGELFYTSGDDRIFPRGFPVGVVKVVHDAQPFKEILVEPIGLQHGLEDVLILIQGVHQDFPAVPPSNQPVYIAPAPAAAPAGATDTTPGPGGAPQAGAPRTGAPPQTGVPPQAGVPGTEADRLRGLYQSLGQAQKHVYGEGVPGANGPDFTKLPVGVGAGVPSSPGGPGPAPGTPAQPGVVERKANQDAGAPTGGRGH